jgi:hypothetical protein
MYTIISMILNSSIISTPVSMTKNQYCKKVKLDLDQPFAAAATNVAKVEECGWVSDHVKIFCGRVWRISRYNEHE